MSTILKNKFTYLVAGGLIAMGILIANYSTATYIPTQTPNNGSYTPTLTNVSNLTASTVYDAQWMRNGNVVTVGGRVDIDPTTPATLTELGISLPIASNIAGLEGVVGTAAASGIAGQSAAIIGDATNNRAQMTWIAGDVSNQSMYYTYVYTIIP